VSDLRRQMQQRIHETSLRREARPKTLTATNAGQAVQTPNGLLRAGRVSRGATPVNSPVVLSAESGIAQQELRDRPPLRSDRFPIQQKAGNIRVLMRQVLDGVQRFYICGDRPQAKLILEMPEVQIIRTVLESTGGQLNQWLVAWKNESTREVGVIYGDKPAWTQPYPPYFEGHEINYRGGGFFASLPKGVTRRYFGGIFIGPVYTIFDSSLISFPTDLGNPTPLTELIFPIPGGYTRPITGTTRQVNVNESSFAGANTFSYQFNRIRKQLIESDNFGIVDQLQDLTTFQAYIASTISQYIAYAGISEVRTGNFSGNLNSTNTIERSDIRVTDPEILAANFSRINDDYTETRTEQMDVAIAPGVFFARNLSDSQRYTRSNDNFVYDWFYNSLVNDPVKTYPGGYVYAQRTQTITYQQTGSTINQRQNLINTRLFLVYGANQYQLSFGENTDYYKLYKLDNLDPDRPVTIEIPSLLDRGFRNTQAYLAIASAERGERLRLKKMSQNTNGQWILESSQQTEPLRSKIYPFNLQTRDGNNNLIVALMDVCFSGKQL
jgi:hypothetical protein